MFHRYALEEKCIFHNSQIVNKISVVHNLLSHNFDKNGKAATQRFEEIINKNKIYGIHSLLKICIVIAKIEYVIFREE